MSKHSIDMPNCVFAAFCLVIDGFMTFNSLFPKKSRISKRDSAFFIGLKNHSINFIGYYQNGLFKKYLQSAQCLCGKSMCA
jgi:hypothetical protein